MKTLHVDTGREMHGGQWQVLYLVERLVDAKLCARASSPLQKEAVKRGIQLGSLHDSTDLVHAHDARAHTVAVLAGRKPLVVSRRVAFPIKQSYLSRRKYERACMYIAVSHYVANRLREAGIPPDKIRVVYDGVPVPDRESTREPGHIVALREKSPDLPGIPIHFVTDLWQDLSTASIFLYSTEMEGLGSAALAAMAAGVPVIASRIGGLPEIVEHDRTGILVDNGQFVNAVLHLLTNPEQAAEMGRRGRELVLQKFTIAHMVEQTKRVYEEVLA
jgi:hypothetical protein